MRRTSLLIMFKRSTNEKTKTRHYMYLSCLGIGMFHIPYTAWVAFLCPATIFMAGRHTHEFLNEWKQFPQVGDFEKKNARHRLVDEVNWINKIDFFFFSSTCKNIF